MKPRLIPFLGAAVIFAADRASKIWIENNVNAFDVRPIVPGFFNIIHSENRGMAFSLLSDARDEIRVVVLVGISIIVLGMVLGMLWKATGGLQRTALSLVLGGAVGNLYDRIFRGSVTDFLDFFVADYHWATFNIADAAITVGALLLAFELILKRESKVPQRAN